MSKEDSLGIIRFLIALGHFDGEFCREEQLVVRDRLKMLKLTEDEKLVLLDDMKNPKNPEDIFKELTPRARARSLDTATVMLKAAQVEIDEKALIEQLKKSHMSTLSVGEQSSELQKTLRTAQEISSLRAENNRLRWGRAVWKVLAWIQ